MPKFGSRFFILTFIILTVSGCSTSQGISMRAYMQDKQRVDQNLEGTLGNWQNSSDVEDRKIKDTRKVYVLEMTQDTESSMDVVVEETTTSRSVVEYEEPVRAVKQTANKPPRATLPSLPTFKDEDYDEKATRSVAPSAASSRPESFVEYTVEKNDTLQKISKKFYGSYSKWPQIFEANKAKMKDPNAIKPGMSLRIPVE